jgi:hypothetical protein
LLCILHGQSDCGTHRGPDGHPNCCTFLRSNNLAIGTPDHGADRISNGRADWFSHRGSFRCTDHNAKCRSNARPLGRANRKSNRCADCNPVGGPIGGSQCSTQCCAEHHTEHNSNSHSHCAANRRPDDVANRSPDRSTHWFSIERAYGNPDQPSDHRSDSHSILCANSRLLWGHRSCRVPWR